MRPFTTRLLRWSLACGVVAGAIALANPRPSAAAVPSLSISDGTFAEDASSPQVTITLDGPASDDVTVHVDSSDGSATTPSDYGAVSMVVTIPFGSLSAPVPLTIVDDSVTEPNETFTLTLTNPNPAATIGDGQSSVTILDNDAPPPTTTTTTTIPPTTTTASTVQPTTTSAASTSTTTSSTTTTTPTTTTTTTTQRPTSPPSTAKPPSRFDPNRRQSAFVNAVPDATEIHFRLANALQNLLVAGGMVMLVGFPGQLFNQTLKENYAEVMSWFRRGPVRVVQDRLGTAPTWLVVTALAPTAALIQTLLSPDVGWNAPSRRLFLGVLIAVPVMASAYDIARLFFMRYRYGLAYELSPQFVGLLIAGVMVLASRAAGFRPGYLYAALTALRGVGHRRADVAETGIGLAFASLVTALVGFAAWLLLTPVKHAAAQPDAREMVLVLQAALSAMWVGGLGALVFGLAPLHFFHGEKVKEWSTSVWLAVYGTAVFVYLELLVHPALGLYKRADDVSLARVVTLFVAFAACSLAFWSYFRFRPARR